MRSSLWLPAWLALNGLSVSGLAAQTGDTVSPPQARYPCGDTALTRWLNRDQPTQETDLQARALYEHLLARTYAPILRFAPSERYFPTMPYWTAFLPEPGPVTPMSVDRATAPAGARHIQPLEPDLTPRPFSSQWDTSRTKRLLPSISAVREKYDDSLDLSVPPYKLKPPLPVVFYRVCDFIALNLDSVAREAPPDSAAAAREEERRLRDEDRRWRHKADYLWSYLRSDEQAWHRFGLDGARTSDTTLAAARAHPTTRSAPLIRNITRFHVIQYFVYYLQDWGLLGHSEDIEYAFVFVPADTTMAKSFRVIVGAGHDPPAPNNVLAMVSRDASKRRYYHANILVELGGHSSAPDVPPFGQFSAGLDVNWHIGDLWGTRDEQATAGLSFSGRYEGTMTYPRDPEDAVTMFPKGFGAGTDSGRRVLADLVRVSPDYLAEQAHKASHRPDAPSAELRELAEAVVGAHKTILHRFESGSVEAIATKESRELVQQEFTVDTGEVYQSAIIEATAKDSAARKVRLDDIRVSRETEILRSVDSLVWWALCAPRPTEDTRPLPRPDCPHWPQDSVRRVAALLETGRRIPADSLMVQLMDLLPDPDTTGSAMDAITTEIKQVVADRLQPEYSLLPVRYLQALYQGALRSDTAMVKRHLKLITRLLHPATCEELACGLDLLKGDSFDLAFDEVVCGLRSETTQIRGSVHWPRSLACRFRESLLDSMKLWNDDVYDSRQDGFGYSRQWPARKHKIWEHELYRRPELIFRTNLFRPTVLQVRRSRASRESLLNGGVTWMAGRASQPYLGVIIPALSTVDVPVKVPGYLAVQVGPYLRWPYGYRKATASIGVLYDRQFAYFYGLYLKGLWVNHRKDTELQPDASEFTWTFGASLWCPCLPRLHLRPGLRFDTRDLRPLLDRSIWEIQLEFRR